jgi:catechol 2,3-dioxygenase-like lactoylglutathione lyase family enzyme
VGGRVLARPAQRCARRRDLVRTCRMRVSLNHVALSARDLERSCRFYEQLLGCERLPAPDVGFPTAWLRLGDRQLHLFERDTPVPPLHHFAVAVVDLGEACRRADALGAFDDAPYGREAYRLPDGTVQLFLRDPDGHLDEVDGAPGAGEPDAGVVVVPLSELRPQDGERLRATLFSSGRPFANAAGPA